MLALLFNRASKRRMVGLLALGEWGPATAAITGLVSTEQARQQSIASGTVVEPVDVVSGGGGGPWIYPLARYPSARSWFDPLRPQQNRVPARGAISGSVKTQQARQQSLAVGTVVNPAPVATVDIPFTIPVIMLVVRASNPRQEITFSGDPIDDDEMEALMALMAAD